MAVLGTRAFLQPVIYAGLAVLLHGILLLIPVGWMTPETDFQTIRGMRVRVVVDAPRTSAVVPPAAPVPPAASGKKLSRPEESGPGGGNVDAGAASRAGLSGGTREGSGSPGEPPRQTDFDRYLSGLRSEGVQGWAKDSTKSASRGWKGSGAGAGGWGTGTGSGAGTGSAGGEGNGRGGGGKGGGAGYLDPRVRMVVTSYPPTGIERRHTAVPYPELKLKRRQYASGWWNVYIMIRTDSEGKVLDSKVMRPETDGELEKMFIGQVRREISRWTFDPVEAEVHVDVRFHVE